MDFNERVRELASAAKNKSWEFVRQYWNTLKNAYTIPMDPTRKRKHGMIEAEVAIDQKKDYMHELYVQCIRVISLTGKGRTDGDEAFYIKFFLAPVIRNIRMEKVKSAQ